MVIIHGSARNANDDFHTMMELADRAIVDDITAVVAPHFECDADHPPPDDLYWACDGVDSWSHGGLDETGSPAPISSYTAMDRLIATLANRQMFPYLTRIVVTGMGAGGQFVDRYAATTGIDPIAGGPTISYAAVAPASYMWLDASRPGSFAGSADCPSYDAYPYGLDGRTGYVAIPDAATIVDRLTTRDVTYFVGSEDTLAHSANTGLDTSCAANAQGVDRITRAINFDNAIATDRGAAQMLVTHPGLPALAVVHVQVVSAQRGDLSAGPAVTLTASR